MKTSNNNENIVLVEKSSFDEKIALEKDKERLCTAIVYERLKKTFRNRVSVCHLFIIDGKKYNADICIKSKRTIIEIHGSYHEYREQIKKDSKRAAAFASIGYRTIRIPNEKSKDGHFLNMLVKELLEIQDIEREKNKVKKHRKKNKVVKR